MKENGVNGLKRLARRHVVRVHKSEKEHVKGKENEGALISRETAESGDFSIPCGHQDPRILLNQPVKESLKKL